MQQNQAVRPAGEPAFTEDQPAKARKRPEEAGLSERQAEVLQLFAQGLICEEAGVRLSLSERTVCFHF